MARSSARLILRTPKLKFATIMSEAAGRLQGEALLDGSAELRIYSLRQSAAHAPKISRRSRELQRVGYALVWCLQKPDPFVP